MLFQDGLIDWNEKIFQEGLFSIKFFNDGKEVLNRLDKTFLMNFGDNLWNHIQNFSILNQLLVKERNKHLFDRIVLSFALIEVVRLNVQEYLHQSINCILAFLNNIFEVLK